MLDRYRTRQAAPAAPDAPATTGAEKAAQVRAAPAAPAAPAGISKDHADSTLEHFAKSQGIDWPAAHSQMVEGDTQAGAAQLAADTGDGIEHAGVACWLRLLAERPTPAYEAWPTGCGTHGTGLDAYGRSLPPARAFVTCGSCANFQPNRDNPEAGIGACKLGEPDQGGWPYFPGARRCCPRMEPQA
jgi:hypothetical protein